jgi:hypothetical protein
MNNREIKISEGFMLKYYTNGSYAYLSESGRWINIPKSLAIKIMNL